MPSVYEVGISKSKKGRDKRIGPRDESNSVGRDVVVALKVSHVEMMDERDLSKKKKINKGEINREKSRTKEPLKASHH